MDPFESNFHSPLSEKESTLLSCKQHTCSQSRSLSTTPSLPSPRSFSVSSPSLSTLKDVMRRFYQETSSEHRIPNTCQRNGLDSNPCRAVTFVREFGFPKIHRVVLDSLSLSGAEGESGKRIIKYWSVGDLSERIDLSTREILITPFVEEYHVNRHSLGTEITFTFSQGNDAPQIREVWMNFDPSKLR